MNARKEFSEALSSLIEDDVNVDFKQGFEEDGIENSFVADVLIASKLDRIANALENIVAILNGHGRKEQQ